MQLTSLAAACACAGPQVLQTTQRCSNSSGTCGLSRQVQCGQHDRLVVQGLWICPASVGMLQLQLTVDGDGCGIYGLTQYGQHEGFWIVTAEDSAD